MLFQELCTRKIKWDAVLPLDCLVTWRKVLEGLKSAKEITIPRYAGHIKAKKAEMTYELHCFTDASKNAYAAIVYLVSYFQGQPDIKLMMSKSRITPVEDKDDLKIPRLELLGYLIGSRLLKYVKNSLELPITHQYLWTDSLIVLNWIHSRKLLPPFVSRRIKEIKQNPEVEYCYVYTKDNPADVATCPESWESKKSLWFNGPDFLRKEKVHWPKTRNMLTGKPRSFLSVGRLWTQ
ncbi:pao retrotransposon peptidase domain-containing protein [Phthorimaea operculella]|nr:pao retrotransposon peptidase domain-containing protein [Phthorimaea operculella]